MDLGGWVRVAQQELAKDIKPFSPRIIRILRLLGIDHAGATPCPSTRQRNTSSQATFSHTALPTGDANRQQMYHIEPMR